MEALKITWLTEEKAQELKEADRSFWEPIIEEKLRQDEINLANIYAQILTDLNNKHEQE